VDPLLESHGIVIPPRGAAPWTGDDDPIDFYYRPVTGRLYRGRLELAAELLGPGPFDALLEIGYGSGVFLPELARRAKRVAGVEVHDRRDDVNEMLGRYDVEADLRSASLFDLPFADAEFDAVVCLSVLEHLLELDRALDEIHHVLESGGVAVLGFPVRNPITDTFFRLTGRNPRELHPSGHEDILGAVGRHRGFELERIAHMPRLLPRSLSAYVACRCRKL
jgi:SAM-dependent methyltransferase